MIAKEILTEMLTNITMKGKNGIINFFQKKSVNLILNIILGKESLLQQIVALIKQQIKKNNYQLQDIELQLLFYNNESVHDVFKNNIEIKKDVNNFNQYNKKSMLNHLNNLLVYI